MNKKTIIFSIIIIIIILVVGFLFFNHAKAPTQNLESNTEQKIEANPQNLNNNQPEIKVESPEIEISTDKGQNPSGVLVCVDKCGDSVCQTEDPNCTSNSDLNCICPEAKEDCPQDCK
jgi:uncharacterized protein YpmB